VRDIRLLDPACGTMHFGLVAFDLLVEMYREEIANAGQPGWPERPPVASDDAIPAAILANNLHGIDIDLRAVQLSALTLFLRAKTLNPKAHLTESRLACADIHMLGGDRLTEFLKKARLDQRPIYGRILAAIQQRLKDADQLGSLLRLEDEIRLLIEHERKSYEKEGRQPDLFGWSKQQFETQAGRQEFWETLEIQIGQALDAFAREQAEAGREQSFFAGETTKGLRLLDIMNQRYDVVVTNPPYMTVRNMNSVLKGYLQKEYPAAKGDLYAAFIQRCTEWLAERGRLGMIAQQSFMFISSYEKLRQFLRDRIAIETLPHVGPRAFEEVTGEKVNTTLLVLRRESDDRARAESVGVYFRLVKEPDAEAKRRRFEQAVAHLRAAQPDPVVYGYRQADFDAIPGGPWVYWLTKSIRSHFRDLRKLQDVTRTHCGMTTSDNARYLRFWWEVGELRINRVCQSREDAKASKSRWFPYMKGGGFRRWYGNQQHVVNWHNDGMEIRQSPSFPRAADRYFCRGVTWTEMGTGRFSTRISPGGFIFDVKGSCAFPENPMLVIGLLNSSFAHYALNLLNPTVSKQVGDVGRVPIPNEADDLFNGLVERAIGACVSDSQNDETTWDFIAPPPWPDGIDAVVRRHAELAEIERQIDEEVYRLYGISDEDRAAIEAELSQGGVVAEDDEAEMTEAGGADESEPAEAAWTRPELARAWISYAVGIVIGRFEPGVENGLGRGHFEPSVAQSLRNLADTDGVMVLDEGHRDDLAAKALEALRMMLGDRPAREVVAEATGRDGQPEDELRRYFAASFFKEHIRQYRKRPVYWLLQSPRKTYGVWLFHERLTADTLFRIRGDEYVGSKLKLLDGQIAELSRKREAAERRQLEKQIAELEELRDDVQAFADRIDRITARGYIPHIDDGVLINMAPLWELIPGWQAEPKKCWQALERGDYDWSHMAMDYWPDRVKEKCKENKSYATEVEAGRRTLAELDWLADQSGDFGAVKLIFGTTAVAEVLLAFVASDRHDEAIVEKEAFPELCQLLGTELGVSVGAKQPVSEARNELCRCLLLAELAIRVEAAGHRLPSLDSVPRPETARQREQLVAVCSQWRNRLDLRGSYTEIANRVQNEVQVLGLGLTGDMLAEVETFSCLESILFESVESDILAGNFAASLPLAQQRRTSFWSMCEPDVQLRWTLLELATSMLLAAERIEAELKLVRCDPAALIDAYVRGLANSEGDSMPWSRMDRHQRHLEHRYAMLEMDGGGGHDQLAGVIRHARRRYFEVAARCAEVLGQALEASGFQTEGITRQRDVFRSLVRTRASEAKTAYLLIDALRYDMAEELVEGLGDDFEVTLAPALVQLPSITEVGMAALMPEAENGMELVDAGGGRVGVRIGDRVLKDRASRWKHFQQAVDCKTTLLKLNDLMKPTKQRRDEIKAAELLLVTSQEIDRRGEETSDEEEARLFMAEVLEKVRRGIRRLAALGVKEILVAADHGHVFVEDVDESMKVDAPGGKTADLHARAWVGRGGAAHERYLRVSAGRLGMAGDLELVFPRGLTCLRCRGAGGGYFHGGISLQEVVVPVAAIRVNKPPAQGVGTTHVMLTLAKPKITTRFFSVEAKYTVAGLFGDDSRRVKVIVRSNRKEVGMAAMAAYGFEEGTQEIVLEKDLPNAITVMLTEDVDGPAVSVHVLDAVSQVELAAIKVIPVEIGI
jgi:hypothetical protein